MMHIPETPLAIEDLDLMQRLKTYADGEATWHSDSSKVGRGAKQACATLHSNLLQLTDILAPILDRATAREMRTFTIHDESHGRKVAHLMWHILDPLRRSQLTPPEIGLMVASAYLHDLGMALDDEERAARLDPDSDLWEKLELNETQRAAIEELRVQSADERLTESARSRARQRLQQAEEALLCQDTRERHATRERYLELVDKLIEFHHANNVRIPDIETCLSFDGDSFKDKLIDICVSHNEDTEVLVQRYFERPRFPRDYPVGSSTADLHIAAAALRLADILDFDRERTPPVMFYYLLPGTLDLDNRSILEWSKHLAI